MFNTDRFGNYADALVVVRHELRRNQKIALVRRDLAQITSLWWQERRFSWRWPLQLIRDWVWIIQMHRGRLKSMGGNNV